MGNSNAFGSSQPAYGSALQKHQLPEKISQWTEKHYVKAAMAIFDEFDTEDVDRLPIKELKLAFKELNAELSLFFDVPLPPAHWTDDALPRILESHNRNRDGICNFAEFLQFFRDYMNERLSGPAPVVKYSVMHSSASLPSMGYATSTGAYPTYTSFAHPSTSSFAYALN